MAESFNLSNFKKEFLNYNNSHYTAAEIAKAEMEKNDVVRAEEAVKSEHTLGELTLGQKLGVGEYVMKQIGETATNIVTGVVSPLTEYLNKYENIFDQEAYTQQFQEFAKQMYYSKVALENQASKGIYIVGLSGNDGNGQNEETRTATKFIMDM